MPRLYPLGHVSRLCVLPEIRFAVELEEEEEEEEVVEKAEVFVASADSFVAMGEGVYPLVPVWHAGSESARPQCDLHFPAH